MKAVSPIPKTMPELRRKNPSVSLYNFNIPSLSTVINMDGTRVTVKNCYKRKKEKLGKSTEKKAIQP